MKQNRIRSTRETSGLSLSQAKRLLGSHPVAEYLGQIEDGVSLPSMDDLRAIAGIYGCSVSWLLGATAELSTENKALLGDIEYTSDRATVREFMEMLSTGDPEVLK